MSSQRAESRYSAQHRLPELKVEAGQVSGRRDRGPSVRWNVVQSWEGRRHSHTATWMTWLSKKARHERTTMCFSLHTVARVGKCPETDRRIVVTRGWMKGDRNCCLVCAELLFGMRKVWLNG